MTVGVLGRCATASTIESCDSEGDPDELARPAQSMQLFWGEDAAMRSPITRESSGLSVRSPEAVIAIRTPGSIVGQTA